MSAGDACRCGERKKPVDQRAWKVVDFKCNHSAFNGYHYTSSDYSSIICKACGAFWRTRAAYVDDLGFCSAPPAQRSCGGWGFTSATCPVDCQP